MRRPLLVACLALVVALASSYAVSAASLDQVLRIVPQGITDVMLLFTDWSQIKTHLGLGFLTGEGPLEFRLELVQ